MFKNFTKMYVTIKSAHCDCERNSCKIGFGQRYMENIFKSEQRQNNVRPLHKKEIVHVKTITSSSLRYIQH